MRGEKVIVRTLGGRPVVGMIWEADESTVYVTDKANLHRLLVGEEAALPIGFPREDVFEYNADKARAIEQPRRTDKWDWESLRPWKVKTRA